MPIIEKNNLLLCVSEKFNEFNDILHCFTTRMGGVSSGEYASLNMGQRRGDDISLVRENIKIALEAMGASFNNLTVTAQNHSVNIKILEEEDIGCGFHKAWGYDGIDALITNIKNVPLMCYSADCVPILIYAADKKVIAAVHAGWRGTVGEIAKKAIMSMIDNFGAETKNIYVTIGPAIGKCCYEVNSDVAEKFIDVFNNYDIVEKCRNNKFVVDLELCNMLQMMSLGVKKENIDALHICTSCNNDLFYSHRFQHGKSGNIGAIIQLI